MRTVCKNPNCGKRFNAERASALYCSSRCRVVAHRARHVVIDDPIWTGEVPTISDMSRAFNADGSRALSRSELAERLLEIAEDADGGKPKTGRRFWYLALQRGHIKPDMSATKDGKRSRDAATERIQILLRDLRKAGRLGWNAVLDLTRELDVPLAYASPRAARARMRKIYHEDMWTGQRFYPILIVEKDTMEPVAAPWARSWRMPFASSRGYSSMTLQYDVARFLDERFYRTGQTALIYFVSDFDPSGIDLQRSWRDALAGFNVSCRFHRLAATRAQVRGLDHLSLEVKRSDSRAESFLALYGNRCWEVEAVDNDVIKRAFDNHVRSWLDVELWAQRSAEVEKNRALL